MEEIFIKEIKVNQVRNIKNFYIPLAGDKKTNLIITGKNGSGKTSLLMELRQFLSNVINGNLEHYDSTMKSLNNLRVERNRLLEQSNPNEQEIQAVDNGI